MTEGKKKRGHSRARALQREKAHDQRRGRKPGRLSLHKHSLRFDAAIFAVLRPLVASDLKAAELTLILDDNSNSADFTLISQMIGGKLWTGISSEYQGGYGDEVKPAQIVAGRAVREFEPETIGQGSSARRNRRDHVAHEAPRLIKEAYRTKGPALAWLVQSIGGLRMLLIALKARDVESRALKVLHSVDPGWLHRVEHLIGHLIRSRRATVARLIISENAVESKR